MRVKKGEAVDSESGMCVGEAARAGAEGGERGGWWWRAGTATPNPEQERNIKGKTWLC